MGKRTIADNQIIDGTNGGNTAETSGNPNSGGPSNSRGRTGTTGTGTGTTGEKRGENIPPKTSKLPIKDTPEKIIVDIPTTSTTPTQPTTPTQKTEKRGRPKGSTKAATKKQAVQETNIDPSQLILILQTVSGIVASRPGMELFALTPKEAESIATPLASILAKNNKVGEIAGEYADYIALLIACGTIMIPKVIMYQAMQPKKAKKQKEVKMDESTPNTIDRGNAQQPGNTVTDSDNVFTTFNQSINDFLAPVV